MEEPGDAQCCNSFKVVFVIFFLEFGAANKSGELVRYLISGWREHTPAGQQFCTVFSSIKFSVDSGGGLRGATRTENSHRAPEVIRFRSWIGFVLVRNILLAAVRVCVFPLIIPALRWWTNKMAADSGMDTCPSPEIADSRKRPLDGDTENGDSKRSHFSSGNLALLKVSLLENLD